MIPQQNQRNLVLIRGPEYKEQQMKRKDEDGWVQSESQISSFSNLWPKYFLKIKFSSLIHSLPVHVLDRREEQTFQSCQVENVTLVQWVFLQVHSRSCTLTKETIAECFLRDSNKALGHCDLSLECSSSQKASLENTNLVKKARLALSGVYIDTPTKRAVSLSPFLSVPSIVLLCAFISTFPPFESAGLCKRGGIKG